MSSVAFNRRRLLVRGHAPWPSSAASSAAVSCELITDTGRHTGTAWAEPTSHYTGLPLFRDLFYIAMRRWQPENTRRQLSARYSGAWPASDWNMSPASLKRIHWRSGNQWSWRNTCVMCSCQHQICWQQPLASIGCSIGEERQRRSTVAVAGCSKLSAAYDQALRRCWLQLSNLSSRFVIDSPL